MSNLIRYDPLSEFQHMRRSLDSLLDKAVFSDRFDSISDLASAHPFWLPDLNMYAEDNLAVDMVETDDKIIVKASIPAVEMKDIVVEEQNGWLSIRAQRGYQQARKQRNQSVRMWRYRVWQRTLRLPAAVDSDKAKAGLENGVLTVTLPKVREGDSWLRRIQVNLPKLALPRLGKHEPKIKIHS